jgi:hypothetical protein
MLTDRRCRSEAAISPASASQLYGHGDGKLRVLIAKSSIEQHGTSVHRASGAGLIRARRGTRDRLVAAGKKLEKRRLVSRS